MKRLADITLAPVILPPEPPVVKLPTVASPDTLSVPDIFAPVPVTVIVVLPTAAIVTLPFAVAIFTLLLPLLIPDELTEINDNPPEPFVLSTCPLEPPVIVTLPTAPRLLVPETDNDVNVPVLVIFGCAAVVTVAAVVALDTAPVTLAP